MPGSVDRMLIIRPRFESIKHLPFIRSTFPWPSNIPCASWSVRVYHQRYSFNVHLFSKMKLEAYNYNYPESL